VVTSGHRYISQVLRVESRPRVRCGSHPESLHSLARGVSGIASHPCPSLPFLWFEEHGDLRSLIDDGEEVVICGAWGQLVAPHTRFGLLCLPGS
jgi:hypothetical protein